MAEYISREAVIRLIETEGFNEKYDLGHPKDNDWFCEEVNRIPAADVVPVVRCKACVYGSLFDGYVCSHPEIRHLCNPDDYCSKGERREEEHDER